MIWSFVYILSAFLLNGCRLNFFFSPFGLRGVVCSLNSLLSILSAGQLWLEQVPATEIKMQELHCAEERKRQLDENISLFA